jgi:hypothetical protein
LYINEHYIDHVFKWDKDGKFTIQESQPASYVSIKQGKEANVDHKLTFLVRNRNTALQLKELFANATFNVVSITDFYIDEYNGIYNLAKGNISADSGEKSFRGTIWLSNRSDKVRYSQSKEDFDSDFETLQTKTSTFASLVNGSADNGTWGTVGSGFGCTVDAGTNTYQIGYEWWNSIIVETDITLEASGTEYVGILLNWVDINNHYQFYISNDQGVGNVTFHRALASVTTTLFKHNFDTNLTNGSTYNIKCVSSAGRFDLFFDNKHLGTIYDYDVPSGKAGLIDVGLSNEYTNFEVKQYIPPTIAVSSGHNSYDHPQLNRSQWSRGKTLNRLTNYSNEPTFETYTSRLLDGDVHI